MAKTKANERVFQGQVIHWIKKGIDSGSIAFQNATNDSSLYDIKKVKFPDILLTLDSECLQPFCGWELKTPKTDVRDSKLLKDAVKKAQILNAKYFVTWNMQTAIIWKTPDKRRSTVKESDNIREFGPIRRIKTVDDITNPEKAALLENLCLKLLSDLNKLYNDEKVNLPLADATVFVGVVADASERMVPKLKEDLNRSIADKKFNKRLEAWVKKQGINKYDQHYRETLSQQITYRILGKILFYISLRGSNLDLPKMELPKNNYKAALRKLKNLFQQALEVDYQAIFEPEITDEIDLSENTVNIIIDLTEKLSKWSFEIMPNDVIGNVFERLIPEDARHTLGQYFTPDNLVDLITSFCVRDTDDYVIDPTCGTGTFLIRSYARLKSIKRKSHHELLSQIWGFDIAGFPAELATINLCRQNFSDYQNFPRVLAEDFFNVTKGNTFEFPPPKKTVETGERIKVEIPEFDAMVGNFPFIRQELIEKSNKGYKAHLGALLTSDWKEDYGELFESNGQIKLSGQADIYAYLFFHTASLLKPGGRMGFITSNSWLDVAYGFELQKFFLSKFKIIAVCESRCEPWFEKSSVNTVFTILERSDDKEENRKNSVKFVKVKKTLNEIFPEDILTESQERWNNFDRFVDKIESIAASGNVIDKKHSKKFNKVETEYIHQPNVISYEDNEVRVRAVNQGALEDEVRKTGQTIKWGRYLRAPDVYFRILEDCANKFVPLGEITYIRRGITSGINKFFYLTKEDTEHWEIEKEFLKPVIKSPKECEKITLNKDDLDLYAFICDKDKKELRGTKALKYIKWGEKQKTNNGKLWPQVTSVQSRRNWYQIKDRKPGRILLPMTTGKNLRAIYNKDGVVVDHRLFEVMHSKNLGKGLDIFLNSSIAFLNEEMIGRANLGDGALEIEGIDWKRLLVLKKDALLKCEKEVLPQFEKISKRPIYNISKETKRKDRIEFEKTVLKALGLKPSLAEEILKGVSELVAERHTLPKLRSKRRKKKKQQDFNKLADEIAEQVISSNLKKFPEAFVDLSKVKCKEIPVTSEEVRLGENFFGKQQICDEDGNHLFDVNSEAEGKYIIYAKKKDEHVLKVPESQIVITKAVQEYEHYFNEIGNKLFISFMEKSGDHSLSENLTQKVMEDYGLPAGHRT